MRRAALVAVAALAARPAAADAPARYGFSTEIATLLELSLFQSLAEHQTNSAILSGAFDTAWLYNGTLLLEDVRALLYTELLASSSDVYFIYSGFTNGAFIGYYNEGVVLAAGGGRAIGWIDDENSTCPDWGIDEQCRAYYAIEPRGWYKTLVALQGDGATAVSSWSSIFRDSTLSATQYHPPGNASYPSTDHSMALCSSLLSARGAFQGVGCTALLLDVLDRGFRTVLADYDDDDVLAYVRERPTGRVVLSSIRNSTQLWDPTYVGSKPPALFYDGADHPVALINRSVAYLDALNLWRNDTVVHDADAGYFYETIHVTDDYLDWSLVVVQAARCPEAYYTVLDDGAFYGSCQACVDGATTVEGAATSCDLCVTGSYRDDETGECLACPSEGFECETTDVTLSALPLEAGFMRMHGRSTEALRCVGGDEACPGGPTVGCAEEDYEPDGPYCSVCKRGSYLNDAGHCHACGKSLGARTAVGLAVSCAALVLLGRYLSSLGSDAAATKRAVATGRLMNKLKSKWRIMFVAFQIVYSQPALLPDVSLPSVLEKQYHALDVVSLDFGALFPFRCSGGDYYTGLLFATLAPIVFVAAVSGATWLRSLLSDRVADGDVKVATATVGVLVTYVVLPAVTTEILAIYDCEALDGRDGDGATPCMRHDYSVRCEGWTYACYRAYATLMILVWPLGVPLLYFALLYRRRRDIDPPVSVAPTDEKRRRASMTRSAAGDVHRVYGRASADEGRMLDEDRLALQIRRGANRTPATTLLFAPYEPPRWWWEVMEIARRLLSTSFLLLFHGSKTRIFFAVAVSRRFGVVGLGPRTSRERRLLNQAMGEFAEEMSHAREKMHELEAVAGKREPPPGLEVAPQPRRTVDFEALVDDDDDSDSDDDPAPIVVGGVDDAAAGDGVECGACGLFLTPEKAVVDAPEHFPDPDEDLEL
ncbi:sulfotransferase [Aureococcus anophagefferens]|nr:sulfotransferase [Aureococcus anophagefferens]